MTRYQWTPKEDITLFELATALGVLLPATGGADPDKVRKAIETLPDTVRRHFTQEKD